MENGSSVLKVLGHVREGRAERLDGILAKDNRPVTWVAYCDPCNPERKVIAVPSTVGCVGKCEFCLSKKRPFVRQLSVEEITFQVLYWLEKKGQTVNFAGEGDCVCSNLDNVCGVVDRLSGLGLRLSFILTTTGNCRNLKRFLQQYIDLPITFYWSLNFLREDQRAYYMPGTKGSSLRELRDIFQKISFITGRKTTVSWVVMAGLNDGDDDVRLLEKYFGGRLEFEIKLMALEDGSLPNVRTTTQDVENFGLRLKKASLPYRIRRIVGGRIKAGCGTTVPLN